MKTSYPKTKGLALSAMFATLLGLFSLVSIPVPFDPVPVTLQVLGVFLIVSLLGPYYGSLSCFIYLMFGAVGLPVFHSGTSGIPVLLGPTGGFLFSFPIAALIGGGISRRVARSEKTDLMVIALSYSISLLIIYSFGTIWLMEYLRISFARALILGTVFFIGFDVLKGIVAAPLCARIRATRMDLPLIKTPKQSTIAESAVSSS